MRQYGFAVKKIRPGPAKMWTRAPAVFDGYSMTSLGLVVLGTKFLPNLHRLIDFLPLSASL
jgi:hypothetical protein